MDKSTNIGCICLLGVGVLLTIYGMQAIESPWLLDYGLHDRANGVIRGQDTSEGFRWEIADATTLRGVSYDKGTMQTLDKNCFALKNGHLEKRGRLLWIVLNDGREYQVPEYVKYSRPTTGEGYGFEEVPCP